MILNLKAVYIILIDLCSVFNMKWVKMIDSRNLFDPWLNLMKLYFKWLYRSTLSICFLWSVRSIYLIVWSSEPTLRLRHRHFFGLCPSVPLTTSQPITHASLSLISLLNNQQCCKSCKYWTRFCPIHVSSPISFIFFFFYCFFAPVPKIKEIPR